MAISFGSDVILEGKLNFNFPGDWLAFAHQRAKTNKGTRDSMTGIDGYNGWRYGTFPLENGHITWMNESCTNDAHGYTHLFKDSAGNWPFINIRGEIHPVVGVLQVIRWVPPYNGTVKMTGHIAHTNSAAGDGLNVWVATMKAVDVPYVNNIETLHVPTTSVHNNHLTFDTTINVTTNKAIYMVVGANQSDSYDTCDAGWNIQYTSLPADYIATRGTSGYGTPSLRDNLADHIRFTHYLPNFPDGQADNGSGGDLGTSGAGEAKMSYFQNAFRPPSAIRTAKVNDTASGAGSGNGSITVKALNLPSTSTALWFRMAYHISTVGLAEGYDITNRYPGMYAANANLEYTFTGLTGGLYGVGCVITDPTLGVTELDVSQTYLMPGITFVERGLIGYVS